MNNEEYNILIDIAKQWGESKPQQFIDVKIKDGSIQCNGNCNVISIDLRSKRLSGSISPSIGSLTMLKELILSDNRLSGTIPSSIGSLSQLKVLDLGDNQLSGSIPSSIGNLFQLEILDLRENQLTGSIPSSIGSLARLEKLDISINQLDGPIPSSIGSLLQLKILHLYNNQLCGAIPKSTGNLSMLKELTLRNNQLSGPIPSSIGGLSQLEKLYLRDNQLTGSIPSSIGSLSQLWILDLSSNQLSGCISPSIACLSKLVTLRLYSNKLSGPIPSTIVRLSQLKELNLNSNQLSGPIPPSIGSLSQLKWLFLYSNQLSGPIPSAIASLSELEKLSLSGNDLSGTIPPLIGSLSQLKILDLKNNKQLSGGLPSMVSKRCVTTTTGTGISRVEIKTKPLNNALDYMFVVSHVVLGYVDLVFDILAIIALSSTDIPIMVANILFIVLNVALGIWMLREDVIGILRTVLHIEQLYEGYVTIVAGHQTSVMVVLKKIDAITRSVPSMFLQLYGLLKSLSHPDSSDNSFLDRFLTPSQILLLSIASSIVGTGLTLASVAPNSGYSIFNRHFVVHYAYYIIEIMNRVVILSMMFFSVDAYGLIVAGLDFLVRLRIGSLVSARNLRDATLLAVQSFGSDHTVPPIFYAGFIMNTTEMFIFLVVLNTHVKAVQEASTTLSVVACVTWLLRIVFYYTGVLDIVPEPMAMKEEPMASREEGIGKNDDTRSVNRIDDSKDIEIV